MVLKDFVVSYVYCFVREWDRLRVWWMGMFESLMLDYNFSVSLLEWKVGGL